MPRRYHSSAAQCPFYRGEDCSGGKSLFCAGVQQVETIRLFFRSSEKINAHKEKFCRADWEECPVAQILDQEEHDDE